MGLQQARAYLRQADPVLARLIDERPDFDPRAWMNQLPPMDLYGALLFQVTGQQLSVAATRRTLARIEDLFGCLALGGSLATAVAGIGRGLVSDWERAVVGDRVDAAQTYSSCPPMAFIAGPGSGSPARTSGCALIRRAAVVDRVSDAGLGRVTEVLVLLHRSRR